MANWQLHEFTIAPGKREKFFDVWQSRLLPLAQRHGPYVGGCWTEKDTDKFIWIVSNEIHRVDDALAEDWPALLVRQERIGTMDVSVPLISLDAAVDATSGLVDHTREQDHDYYRLDIDNAPPNAAASFASVLEGKLLPALRSNDFDIVGAWRTHDHSRFYHLIGFKDEEDFKAKKSALTATPEWQEIDSAIGALPIQRKFRELEICRF